MWHYLFKQHTLDCLHRAFCPEQQKVPLCSALQICVLRNPVGLLYRLYPKCFHGDDNKYTICRQSAGRRALKAWAKLARNLLQQGWQPDKALSIAFHQVGHTLSICLTKIMETQDCNKQVHLSIGFMCQGCCAYGGYSNACLITQWRIKPVSPV